MIFKAGVALFVYFLTEKYVVGFWNRPLVETEAGLVRGLRGENGEYFMFLGIPYGKVNEQNPFGVAKPYPRHDSIFEAHNDNITCLQPSVKGKDTILGYGTVDCLRLNIFVPYSVAVKNPVPVMVWFHGGKFQYGSSSRKFYGPQYLLRHDVIIVTVNYRLGAFGFLCLNIPEVPGNQGLKDQALALRWIKNNIKSFGGDENSITFVGESAGSKSADLHIHSNLELLFHRTIMQGGSTNTILPDLRRDDTATFLRLADKLGIRTNDTYEALRFMKNLNPKSIAAATYTNTAYEFGPCVEQKFVDVEAFITDNPINLEVPKAKNITFLIGYNSADQFGDFMTSDPLFFENWKGFQEKIRAHFDLNEKIAAAMERVVRHFYIGQEKININVRLKLAKFATDFGMLHPIKRTIQKYLKNGANKIYLYMFSYVGGRNFLRGAINSREVGALHADELGYLFDIPYFQRWSTTNVTPEDQLIIDRMTKLWTNFVKYGDPTPQVTELLPVKWKPITSRHLYEYYLNINTTMTLEKSPYHERMAFWDLFYSIHEKHQRGLKPFAGNLYFEEI